MREITLCVPFYRNSAMLVEQVTRWNAYKPHIRVVLVDDGSPEPALPVVKEHATQELLTR